MSWSISTSGTPEEVAMYLDEQSGKLTGQAKAEYDDALSSLKGLVLQNFNSGGTQPTVQIMANGHGSESGGKQLTRECNVTLKRVGILLMLFGLSAVYSSAVKAADDVKVIKPVQAETVVQSPAQKSVPVQAPVQKETPVQKSSPVQTADHKVSREFGACANGSCGLSRGGGHVAGHLVAGLGRHDARKARRQSRRE